VSPSVAATSNSRAVGACAGVCFVYGPPFHVVAMAGASRALGPTALTWFHAEPFHAHVSPVGPDRPRPRRGRRCRRGWARKTVALEGHEAYEPLYRAPMRRFELVEGSSSKFWEVSLEGTTVTVRFGRIGTEGQAKSKVLASPAAARAEHDKLVVEKTRKGYRETAAKPRKAAAEARSTAPAKGSIAEHLTRLRALYEKHDAPWRARKGATDAAIDALAKVTGIDVGPLRELWKAEGSAGIVLGVKTATSRYPVIFESPQWAAKTWKFNRSMSKGADPYVGYVEKPARDPRIASGWYNVGWLPIGDFGGGHVTLYYDAAPGPGGKRGQIIAYTHDPDAMHHVVDSLADLLSSSLKIVASRADDWLADLE